MADDKKPVEIPFLPGNTFADPRKTEHRKPHTLTYKCGVPIAVTDHPTIGGGPHLATTMRKSVAEEFADLPERGELDFTLTYGTKKPAPAPRIPAHIALEKKVLSFNAWFSQTENPVTGTERFRFVKINLFLVDDTINVWEERTSNTGIPQGMLVRRQRIPVSMGSKEHVTENFLSVGGEVTIFGVKYHLFDCDAFTRAYYGSKGVTQKPAEAPPKDEHREKRQAIEKPKRQPAASSPDRFQLAKFLEQDGRVLRFSCLWDSATSSSSSSSSAGEEGGEGEQPVPERGLYILAFFLVDDTVEVREIRKPNDGKEGFTLFLKRQRLPKSPLASAPGAPGSDKRSHPFVTDAELGIGAKVNVLGREFLLYDCDQYTKEYYKTTYGVTDWPKVDVKIDDLLAATGTAMSGTLSRTAERLDGTSRPSPMASRKLVERQGKTLRFRATLTSDNPEFKGRVFGVALFLADDQVSVAEFVAGAKPGDRAKAQRFLERGKYKNPARAKPVSGMATVAVTWDEFYQPSDFFVGATVDFGGWKFNLIDADEQTLELMESMPAEFPYADPEAILANISSRLSDSGLTTAALTELFSTNDQGRAGAVTQQQFRDLIMAQLSSSGGLVEHELITICRRFGSEDSSKFCYPEFIQRLGDAK